MGNGGEFMLSRVAFNAFWMSRYVERAENMARFIDVNLHLMLDLQVGEADQWAPLVKVTGDRALFEEQYDEATRENVIDFLTFDEGNPSSILSCLRQARENARSIREVISSELWQQANELYLMITSRAASRQAKTNPNEFYSLIKKGCTLFKGLSDATMTHGECWQFIRVGRMTERADKTSRMLDVKYFMLLPQTTDVGTPYDNIQWAAVLKSASALEMYRIQYHRISPASVAEFLILNRNFPRSMRFCVATAESALHNITGAPDGTYSNEAERRIGRLTSDLDFADIEEVLRGGLHEYLDGFQTKLNDVGDAIFETFFAMRAPSSRQKDMIQ